MWLHHPGRAQQKAAREVQRNAMARGRAFFRAGLHRRACPSRLGASLWTLSLLRVRSAARNLLPWRMRNANSLQARRQVGLVTSRAPPPAGVEALGNLSALMPNGNKFSTSLLFFTLMGARFESTWTATPGPSEPSRAWRQRRKQHT